MNRQPAVLALEHQSFDIGGPQPIQRDGPKRRGFQMLAAQCAYISLVAGLRSEAANVVAPLASQSAMVRVASLTGAPASSCSRGPTELVADVLAGAAVDGVPRSLTVVGVGDRTLVADDLAVLHPLVDAAVTVRVLAHIRYFPLASTWGSRPTSLHLAAQRLAVRRDIPMARMRAATGAAIAHWPRPW
jgi:hypothetical protein